MDRNEILHWLRLADEAALAELWARADGVRARCVGDAVHLRGLIEVSNYCSRNCHYCGIRVDNHAIQRYRMSADEVLACADAAVRFGYGTVVLQAGEDYGIRTDWVADVIRRIRAKTNLAITLSLGERGDDELESWREAGADRYLLRFETSNRALFAKIHPPLPGREPVDRIALLHRLRELGYEVGSGVMIGIPGQSYEDLARDVERFARLDLDMIGVGPFLPHPNKPLGRVAAEEAEAPRDSEQVPNTELMTYKVVALTRLTCPHSNIPSTTALATLNRANGRELGLMRGANIIMPNLTPPEHRCKYEIYPAKACLYESAEACNRCVHQRILSMGRTIGHGRGDSPNRRLRAGADG